MRLWILPLLFCLLTSPSQAKSFAQKVEKEVEGFYKAYFRAHPESSEEKSTRKAVAELLERAKKDGIFNITPGQDAKIKEDEPPVSEDEFNKIIEELRKANAEDSEPEFLLKGLDEMLEKGRRIDEVDHFWMSQLAKVHVNRVIGVRKTQNTSALSAIAEAFGNARTDKKKGVPFDDLNLLDEYKKYVVPETGEKIDWAYWGAHTPPVLDSNKNTVVVITPHPVQPENNHFMATYPVNVFSMSPESFQQTQASLGGGGGGAKPAADSLIGRVVEGFKKYKETHAGQIPKVISQMGISPKELRKEDGPSWVYVPSASKGGKLIKSEGGRLVLLCHNKVVDGGVAVVLEDGTRATATPAFFDNLEPEKLK